MTPAPGDTVHDVIFYPVLDPETLERVVSARNEDEHNIDFMNRLLDALDDAQA